MYCIFLLNIGLSKTKQKSILNEITYSNLHELLINSDTCERFFSAMRRVKMRLRPTIFQNGFQIDR